MPRKRDIKPGFFKNEELGELEPLARLLFAGLWCWADKEGRFEDRPKKLKADILPYDECDGEHLLQQLADHGFIVRYEVDGLRCGQIINWDKHQKPHPKETDSEIPPYIEQPESNGISMESNGISVTSNVFSIESNVLASEKESTRIPIPSFTSIPSSTSLKESLRARESDSVLAEISAEIQKIRPLATDIDKNIILDVIDHFPRDWIREAIQLAIDKKARSYGFIQSVLNNWRSKGFADTDKPWEVESHGGNQRRGFNGRDKPGKTGPGAKPSQTDWENEPDHL